MAVKFLQQTILQFKYNDKIYIFDVLHNLDNHGLEITDALENYGARIESCDSPNIKDFCNYVTSKDPMNLICKPSK